jgi:N-acyl-D-aspartate/D-glutamate deacylase
MRILLFSLLFASSALAQTAEYDIVLKNGRVMDPETGLDAIRNVGIRGNRIAEISANPLAGKQVIDVSNLVISPGFIDPHVHGLTNKEHEYQVHDGVTTALELEGGIEDIGTWLASQQGKTIINYGGSACHPWARAEVLYQTGRYKELAKQSPKFNYLPVGPSEMKATLELLDKELKAGALGIGVPIGYYPGATREEIYNVYEFAALRKSLVFTHVREGKAMAIQQAIADAATNGTSLHIVHVNSMALDEIELAVRMVGNAQRQGLDITTELYPYTAGSTSLESAIFDEGWQQRLNITYKDLQWVETGERLTEETFASYRKKGGTIILHSMKPEWIETGLKSPVTMIGSDGMPYSRLAHPRTAGTYSRILGVYVRERKALTLMEALRKMTIMPAQRLETVSPMMRNKGRMQVGADADITIFDPNTIIDKATFEGGLKFSEGIHHVMVNGVFVVRDGKTIGNVFPGQPILGKYRQ